MNVSPKELKSAYQLVTQDLFSRLLQASPQQTLFLGSRGALGSFKKTENRLTSSLDGQTYAYYRINFKPSRKLKAALNQALEKKYRKK
jgi:hypothetical protein